MVWGVVPRRTTLLKLKGSKDVVVQVRFPKNPLASLTKMHKVGQYVFVNFPTVSFLEWHPYSG
jgi:hypothetical protein